MYVAECMIRPGFYALLMLVFFFPEVHLALAAGAGLAGRLTVEGILKRLFSLRQRRAMWGYSGHSICFPSSSRVAAGLVLVGSFLIIVSSVESN